MLKLLKTIFIHNFMQTLIVSTLQTIQYRKATNNQENDLIDKYYNSVLHLYSTVDKQTICDMFVVNSEAFT